MPRPPVDLVGSPAVQFARGPYERLGSEVRLGCRSRIELEIRGQSAPFTRAPALS